MFCLPIVIMSVRTFFAQTLIKRQAEANIEPAIVTARQPYLLTNEDEIGPDNNQNFLVIFSY